MLKQILLLDDDPDEKEILQDAFDELEIPVLIVQFQTFPALCEYLEEGISLPDLLLLDVNIPAQTGVECIRLLKAQERYTHLPVVMYTNAADEYTIDQCFNFGASVYLKKTTSMALLKQHITQLMAWNLQTVFQLPLTDRTLLN